MLNHEEDYLISCPRQVLVATGLVGQLGISMRVVYHTQVQFYDVVQDDTPLLVDGVVLNPVLLFSL